MRLQQDNKGPVPRPFLSRAPLALQRSCACGGSAGKTGACEKCSGTRLSLRRSTEIAGQTQNSAGAPPIVHEVLSSPGQPLDQQTRALMEPRFGHDFSRVRVHTDTQAAQSARDVNSLAYTIGQHIVFANDRYRPGTEAGDRLLAHELTHTIQQGASDRRLQASFAVGSPRDAAETEADAVAAQVILGKRPTISREGSWRIARQDAATATATATTATEDPGAKRARVAKELVDKLKAAKATYTQENPRDWENSKVSDCSKFVQWVLEGAGEGELFGRDKARTSSMREVIAELTPADQPSFRLTDPKVGDIMMWGGHVGIVYELVEKESTKYLVFAHMGTSGASLLGKSVSNGKDVYWLKASDTAKIDSMGSGAFLGFWTPP